jgi:8-oxo-dGTP diphosphatase
MNIGSDYIGVSAGAVIANGQGEYFLAKRGLAARDDVGTWEFPGGTIKFYETREDAAKRNVIEKYNIEIQIVSELGVYEVIDKEKGDHWISTTYLCKYISGDIKIANTDKCTAAGWFTLDTLQTLDLSRISKCNLADILNRNNQSNIG